MIRQLFITGLPGVGKTTLIKKLIKDLDATGFYTEQILENNIRAGFKIKTLAGQEGILAKVGLNSSFKLGRYGINIKDLEEIALKEIEEGIKNKKMIVIDEIGKMEFFSEKFKEKIFFLLKSDLILLAVLHRDFINLIKNDKNKLLIELKKDNYEEVLNQVKEWLKKIKNED